MIEYHKGNKPGKMPQQRMTAGIRKSPTVDKLYNESFPPITLDAYRGTKETEQIKVYGKKNK